MSSADSFSLIVVTPEKILFEGQIVKLISPGIFQEIAILPNHTPLYAQLIKGELTIHPKEGPRQSIPIEGGILRVKRNQASIIVGFDEEKNHFPSLVQS